jgi:predicted nuclease with TOPRIM domain
MIKKLALTFVALVAFVFIGCGGGGSGVFDWGWDFTNNDAQFNDINKRLLDLETRFDELTKYQLPGDNTVVIDQETLNQILTDISDLKDQVGVLEGQLDDLKTEVGDINDRLTALEAKCANIESAIGAINGRLDAIEAAIADLKNGEPPAQRGVALFTGFGEPGDVGAKVGDFYIDLNYDNGYGYDMYVFTSEGWHLFGYIKTVEPSDPPANPLSVQRL